MVGDRLQINLELELSLCDDQIFIMIGPAKRRVLCAVAPIRSFQSAADARELSKSAKLLRLSTRRVAT